MLKFFNGSFAVFCYEYGYGRMEGGDWYFNVFKKMFNGLSSILDLKHFNMNLNDNVHQCEQFVMDF